MPPGDDPPIPWCPSKFIPANWNFWLGDPNDISVFLKREKAYIIRKNFKKCIYIFVLYLINHAFIDHRTICSENKECTLGLQLTIILVID